MMDWSTTHPQYWTDPNIFQEHCYKMFRQLAGDMSTHSLLDFFRFHHSMNQVSLHGRLTSYIVEHVFVMLFPIFNMKCKIKFKFGLPHCFCVMEENSGVSWISTKGCTMRRPEGRNGGMHPPEMFWKVFLSGMQFSALLGLNSLMVYLENSKW